MHGSNYMQIFFSAKHGWKYSLIGYDMHIYQGLTVRLEYVRTLDCPGPNPPRTMKHDCNTFSSWRVLVLTSASFPRHPHPHLNPPPLVSGSVLPSPRIIFF